MTKLSYSGLLKYKDFGDRLKYLQQLDRSVISPRHISNGFYKSSSWLNTRREIAKRDLGCDLGVFGIDILDFVIIHHINPIDESDILTFSDKLLDPENLITTSANTHNLIHYGNVEEEEWKERTPGDTKLW